MSSPRSGSPKRKRVASTTTPVIVANFVQPTLSFSTPRAIAKLVQDPELNMEVESNPLTISDVGNITDTVPLANTTQEKLHVEKVTERKLPKNLDLPLYINLKPIAEVRFPYF